MNISETAGGVVVGPQGKVAVVEQGGNTTWSLPKGHVESGEDLLATARREIEEETGLTQLELVKQLPSYERFKMGLDQKEDTTALKKMHFFLFRTTQTELKPNDKDNPQAIWVEKENVAQLLTHAKDKEFFLSIIDQI